MRGWLVMHQARNGFGGLRAPTFISFTVHTDRAKADQEMADAQRADPEGYSYLVPVSVEQ